jgi:hypothetical protein
MGHLNIFFSDNINWTELNDSFEMVMIDNDKECSQLPKTLLMASIRVMVQKL